MADPTYKVGSTGPEVTLLQGLLLKWGFDPGSQDGRFGPKTQQALQKFQQYHGLPQTGAASGTDWSFLQSQALYDGIKNGDLSPGMSNEKDFAASTTPVLQAAAGPHAPGQAGILTPDAPVTQAQPAPVTPPTQAPKVNVVPATPTTVVKPDTTTALGANATPAQVDEYIKNNYATSMWALAIPEVAEKLKQGAREGWVPGRLKAELQSTNWWNTTQAATRDWEERKGNDPEGVKATLVENARLIRNEAGKLGVTLDDTTVATLAEQKEKLGWTTPEQLTAAVAGYATKGPDLTGDIGAKSTSYKALASQYYVPLDDDTAFNFAKRAAAGEIDDNTVLNYVRTKAKGMFAGSPDVQAQLDQGLTTKDIVGTQVQQAANLLEIDPKTVDMLNDPRFQPILQHADEKGNMRPLTLSETTQYVKGLDDYWKTGNAQTEVSQKMTQVGRIMGVTV